MISKKYEIGLIINILCKEDLEVMNNIVSIDSSRNSNNISFNEEFDIE